MKNLRKLSRRSFMSRVSAGVVRGGPLAAFGSPGGGVPDHQADTGESDPANRTA